ncbi:hypothetical protein KCU88_g20, partial [Aureobasidium melanogenum]
MASKETNLPAPPLPNVMFIVREKCSNGPHGRIAIAIPNSNFQASQVNIHSQLIPKMRSIYNRNGNSTILIDIGTNIDVLDITVCIDANGSRSRKAKGVVACRVLRAPPVYVARCVGVDECVVNVHCPLEPFSQLASDIPIRVPLTGAVGPFSHQIRFPAGQIERSFRVTLMFRSCLAPVASQHATLILGKAFLAVMGLKSGSLILHIGPVGTGVAASHAADQAAVVLGPHGLHAPWRRPCVGIDVDVGIVFQRHVDLSDFFLRRRSWSGLHAEECPLLATATAATARRKSFMILGRGGCSGSSDQADSTHLANTKHYVLSCRILTTIATMIIVSLVRHLSIDFNHRRFSEVRRWTDLEGGCCWTLPNYPERGSPRLFSSFLLSSSPVHLASAVSIASLTR